MQVVSLSLFRFEGFYNKLWAFSQMGWARPRLARVPDLAFFKLFGTGTEEGFNPKPNWGVYAIMAGWPDLETAKQRVGQAPIYDAYRGHAAEHWTGYMRAFRCWGEWAGVEPFEVDEGLTQSEPIAVLTRATVKLRHVREFWSTVPKIQADVGVQDDLYLKIGMGEVPWVHQVTFSIWPDVATMQDFSKNDAAHGEGVRKAWENGWFKEQLFARFALLDSEGAWNSWAG